MRTTERPLRVGVLAYDGCLAAEIFGMADLLLMANRIAQASDAAQDRFEVSVVGRTSAPVTAAGGLQVGATRWHSRLDVLVVPGFELVSRRRLGAILEGCRAESDYIGRVAARGIPVASVCVGAFLLGEAGVLDGRGATTAWLFAGDLAARYPRAAVSFDSMIVTDGHVTTCAAFSAVHDLALDLIRRHAGDEVARSTARVALVPDNRTSQAPYVEPTMVPSASARFAEAVKRWLLERLAASYDLHALSAAFHVSTRTMLRRFRSEAGETPLEFLQHARIEAAKRLLESPGSRVAEVMAQVGYADPGSFRRLFQRQVGVTPAAYRRQFRAPEPSAVGSRDVRGGERRDRRMG